MMVETLALICANDSDGGKTFIRLMALVKGFYNCVAGSAFRNKMTLVFIFTGVPSIILGVTEAWISPYRIVQWFRRHQQVGIPVGWTPFSVYADTMLGS